MINKDTKVFGSFSKQAGNNGCMFFNTLFSEHKIDAIYKSYSVENIEDAVSAARTLNFSGFAVSMPFKVEVMKHVEQVSETASRVGSSNTILNIDGTLIAHNTDYDAALQLLRPLNSTIYILGDGGLSKAVQAASTKLSLAYEIITRSEWDRIDHLKNSVIINCTPVDSYIIEPSNTFFDLRTTSLAGANFASIQAKKQFFLYTGISI
jgi:shikimate 5-dehydrogenase